MHGDRSVEGFAWQVGIWDKLSTVYEDEVDTRFTPVIHHLMARADLKPGQAVLDLGTGTGSVAFEAAAAVGPDGTVTGVDISPEMLAVARARASARSLNGIDFVEGRGEAIPAPDRSQDAVLASLSLMYVIDRAAAAAEVARVLRPGGRFVAAVWSGPDTNDIVKFQQTAGRFAPEPPVDGVGPGALADPSSFLLQLGSAGLDARVDVEVTTFVFPNFEAAWDVLAGVTTASLDPERQAEAKAALRALMWPAADDPLEFRNDTQYIVAVRPHD